MKKIRRLSKKFKSGKRVNSVLTRESEFLSLFPHRYDFIEADYPANPDDRPQWRTEDRFPLTDRMVLSGRKLYGVSFGPTTDYLLLDIDPRSVHYPSLDPLAIGRIVDTLEPLGLTNFVAVQSSHRGGLHLFFPFDGAAKPSYAVALVVTQMLRDAGIRVAPGHLEVFPNPKPYNADRATTYKAHRLPLQTGSYLLNEQWETVYSHPANFIERWKFAKRRNLLDEATYARVLEDATQTRYKVSVPAAKFLTDLTTAIESGWTDSGQTNELLRRVAERSYIFGHVLAPREALEGQALVDEVMAIAQSLPGYADYCNHKHELEKRCRDWATWVEQNRYHYGRESIPKPIDPILSIEFEMKWNQWQKIRVRERIQEAIDGLTQQGLYPETISGRVAVLRSYDFADDSKHLSTTSLYNHKDLWHPHHQPQTVEPLPTEASEEFHPDLESIENQEMEELLEAAVDKVFHPVPLNELMGACEGVAACAPTGQQAQAIPSHSTSEDRGGTGGGAIPELRDPIRVPDWMTGAAALEFAIELQCCNLEWSVSRLEQYAIEVHGMPLALMNEWELDCLLSDLMGQRPPGAVVGN